MALYNFIRSCVNSHTLNAVKKATSEKDNSAYNTSYLESIKIEEEKERRLKEKKLEEEKRLKEKRLTKERVLREKWIEKQRKLKKGSEVSKDVKGKKNSKKRKREILLAERAIAKEFKKYLEEKER